VSDHVGGRATPQKGGSRPNGVSVVNQFEVGGENRLNVVLSAAVSQRPLDTRQGLACVRSLCRQQVVRPSFGCSYPLKDCHRVSVTDSRSLFDFEPLQPPPPPLPTEKARSEVTLAGIIKWLQNRGTVQCRWMHGDGVVDSKGAGVELADSSSAGVGLQKGSCLPSGST
jgi:hypothetical protein